MKRNLISIDLFATAAQAVDGDPAPFLKAKTAVMRASTAVADLANSTGRIIRYKFSDSSVGRDGHTVSTRGWVLDEFLKNPVFLWVHDTTQPPIGRVLEIGTKGDNLSGDVEYAAKDQYAFADTIFELVRGGFLNAVSASWRPLEWKFSTDRSRVGGIDFTKQELLEISQAPVPILASALVQARAAGTKGLDFATVRTWCEKALDERDPALGARGDIEALREAAKEVPAAKPAPNRMIRGMYDVSQLASCLATLGYVEDSIKWEAEWEADGSGIPARLLQALRDLGQILVDMTEEEVAEMFAGDDAAAGGTVSAALTDKSAKTPAQRAMLLLAECGRQLKHKDPRFVLQCRRTLTKEMVDRIKETFTRWHAKGDPASPLVLDGEITLIDLQAQGRKRSANASKTINPLDLLTMKPEELIALRNAGRIKIHQCTELHGGCDYIEILDPPPGESEKEIRERKARAIEIAVP